MKQFISKHTAVAGFCILFLVCLVLTIFVEKYPYIVLFGFAGFFFAVGGIVGYMECYTKHIKKEITDEANK